MATEQNREKAERIVDRSGLNCRCEGRVLTSGLKHHPECPLAYVSREFLFDAITAALDEAEQAQLIRDTKATIEAVDKMVPPKGHILTDEGETLKVSSWFQTTSGARCYWTKTTTAALAESETPNPPR